MKSQLEAYTLIELMVTTALLGILAAAATPSFSSLIDNKRQLNSVNTFVAELHFARSEAVKRIQNISICPSITGAECDANDWSEGRILFVDANSDGNRDDSEQIIRISPSTNENIKIVSSDSLKDFISYRTSGISNTTGVFTICDSRGDKRSKSITINLTGRPQQLPNDETEGINVCPQID